MINFMLLKFLNAIARPRQINWRTEGIKTSGSIFFFFAKARPYNDWSTVGNSAITEADELKKYFHYSF